MSGQGGGGGGLGVVGSGRSPVGKGRYPASGTASNDDCNRAAGSGDVGVAGRA
jgi:hypothetical protein